nr:tyrosine-protein phosphatase [Lacticaseibacillus kribbianus]
MVQLLNIHHGYNFRDLGGYRTADGRTVADHRLVRAGKLDRLSERDQAFLGAHGVTTDLDFRSPEERAEAPDRLPVGADYDFNPVFPYDKTQVTKSWAEEQAEFAFDAKGGYKNMLKTYREFITNATSQKAYRHFFDLLLAKTDGTVLFHCSAGKDRTGMAAVFALAALGVPEATIREDYLATNQYVGGQKAKVIADAKREGANANMQQSLADLWIARPEYLDAALATIASEYGGMARYLEQGLALSAGEQADLKRLYLKEA